MLGQLPGECRRPVPEHRQEVREHLRDPVRRLVPHHRCREARVFGCPQSREGRAPCGAARRREAQEQVGVRRQARQGQRGNGGIGAGNGGDLQAGGDHGAHQPETGIGHQRRTRVADQSQLLPRLSRRQQAGDALILVVVVEGFQPRAEAEGGKQPAGDPAVFTKHDIGQFQSRDGTRCHVAQVADRRGNQHKTRRHPTKMGPAVAGGRWCWGLISSRRSVFRWGVTTCILLGHLLSSPLFSVSRAAPNRPVCRAP
jgi:hypothetical protein